MIRLDPSNPKGIVWLSSYPKSGNTWVRAFLYALLQVRQGAAIDDIDLNAVAYFGENERLVPYYMRHLPGPAALVDPAAVAAARPKVQADIARGSTGPVLIKTHNAMIDYRGAPLINRAVSAGAVYVVRNPLDIAISLAHFRAISIDDAIDIMSTSGFATETNADDVYFVAGSWSENVRSWTERPSPMVLALRYEDMLENATESFTTLANHMLMPATPEQIAQAIELASFRRMQKSEAEKGFLEKPPHADRFFRVGRAGQWRDSLSAAQVERIVAANREEMARFGYLPD